MRGRRRGRAGVLFLAALLGFLTFGIPAKAARPEEDPEIAALKENLKDYDFSEIEELLEGQAGEGTLSFPELVGELLTGDVKTFFRELTDWVGTALGREITTNRSGLWQVLLLATIGALFTNLASVFEKDGISEMGFFITYLLLTSILLAGFGQAAEVASELVVLLLNFMSVLLPTFFLAAAVGGGTLTSLAFYEFTMIVIAVVQWLLANLFLPLIEVYVIARVLNHLSKEELFTKAADLMKTLLNWSLKGLLGLVTGYSLIQSLILPYVDAVKTGTVTKVIGALPGIGNSFASLASLVLGTGALIKNGIGTAALIVLIFLSAVPLLKLALIYLMYAAAMALMEPISDKRIVGCVEGVADGVRLLLKTAFTGLLLFLITIAILCACTNLSG